MAFKAEVTEQPARRLIGMKVRTTLEQVSKDAPALWQRFGPRIAEVVGDIGCPGSYGPCVMTDGETFEYWAAVAAPEGKPVPEGMETMTLPAGLYVRAVAPSLAELGAVYSFLYEGWPKTQDEYVVDKTQADYEYYPPNWNDSQPLEVYAPVRRK